MKSLLNKIASTASIVVLFCVGAAMAGLGIYVVAVLAAFALALGLLSLLAAPFIRLATSKAAAHDRARGEQTTEPWTAA
ncbi:MAG: hypothetical protein AAFY73_00645 [Pseudomonadota bacterium]